MEKHYCSIFYSLFEELAEYFYDHLLLWYRGLEKLQNGSTDKILQFSCLNLLVYGLGYFTTKRGWIGFREYS